MGSILRAVRSFSETITAISLGVVLPLILSAISPAFKKWYVEAMEPVMALFGIRAEDVVQVQMIDQRLMNDNDIKNLLTKLALTHQDTQQDIIDILTSYTHTTRASMGSYYEYGKSTYTQGLPSTSAKTIAIPSDLISYINTEYGITNGVLLTASLKVPTKTEYLYYKLNKLYGYLPYTNTMIYTGLKYTLKYMDYNYTTNLYDCGFYRTMQRTTLVTVVVTNIDATTDNKKTTTKVTEVLFESTTITETIVNEVVPINTVVGSSTTTVTNHEVGPIVLSVVVYNPVNYYVATWEVLPGNIMYWIYQLGSGVVALDNSSSVLSQLDMMPIVELRNNGININAVPTSTASKQTAEMMAMIGLDLTGLMNGINASPDIANVTDVYVYFGADISDTSPVMAKFLYETFNILYAQNSGSESTGYTVTTAEGTYNSALSWKQQKRTVVTGVIGPIGTYTNTVGAIDNSYLEWELDADGNPVGTPWTVASTVQGIKLRKQETETQYVEYAIAEIAANVFIKKGAFWGVTTISLAEGGIRIPVSKFVLDKMTSLEQIEMYGKTLRMVSYALSVQHLQWYQTPAFFQLIQIVLVIIAIVVTVLSWGSMSWTIGLALGFAASMAIMFIAKRLMEMTDNPYLKAVIGIVAVVASAWASGGFSLGSTAFTTSSVLVGFCTALSMTVNSITLDGMEELNKDRNIFSDMSESAFAKLDEMQKSLESYIDTEFLSGMKVRDMKGYLPSVDAFYFQAVGMNNMAVQLSKELAYTQMYDYGKYYRLGVV